MTLPGGIAQVVVTGEFVDPSGQPLQGRVTLTPTADLTDPANSVVIPAVTRAYTLSRGRFTSDPLVATDNDTVTPTGWAYTVAISLAELEPISYEVLLPQATTPVDLSALTPVAAQPAVSAYLTLAGGTLAGKLTLAGGLQIPSGAASGDVLTSDSSGNASWAPTGAAALNSPAFTGTPTAPTKTALTNSTALATTAYADSAVSAETSRAVAAELTKPTVFNPMAYGAAGNALQVGDGAMTASSATLTCSTSHKFTSALVNVGQTVVVQGAGSAGADLVTTISGFTSTSVVTLAATASTTVTGATVTFGTDDTTALQNCLVAAHTVNGIVDLGHLTYLTTSPLSIVSGLVIRGAGQAGGAITNASSSLFSITGSKSNWTIQDCALTASAGHVFDCSASGTTVSKARILNATITQVNASYGVWYMPDGNYLNMLVGDGCFISAPASSTTAPWYIVSGNGGVASANANTWRQMTVLNNLNQTVPFFYIESVSTHTTSFSFNSDLVFRDITAEECSGGIIQAKSVANLTIDGVGGYDTSYFGHVFSVSTSSAGAQASRNIIVRNSGRRDGGLSTGICDFFASADTINVILENVGPGDAVSSAVSYSAPQSATILPLQTLVPIFYLNTAAGGTNSTTVTTGNSGGNSGRAWSAVNGTVTYDNSQILSGASPLAYNLTGSGTAANMAWSLSTSGVTAPPTVYLRTYFQFTGSPFVADVLTSNNLNYRLTFDFPNSGVFNLRAAPGSFVAGLFAPSAGTWYRAEMQIALASGTAAARIYNLDGVMLDSISASGGISSITSASFGSLLTYTGTMWLAFPAYSNQDWIGP